MTFRPSFKSLLSSWVKVLKLRLTILSSEPIRFEEDLAAVLGVLISLRARHLILLLAQEEKPVGEVHNNWVRDDMDSDPNIVGQVHLDNPGIDCNLGRGILLDGRDHDPSNYSQYLSADDHLVGSGVVHSR